MINISLRNINKYYKDKIILDNINLDIESSNISIKGKVIKNLSDNDKAEIRMKELGFVFQGFF